MFSNLDGLLYLTGQYGPVIVFAISVFLVAEAFFISLTRRRRKEGLINERMRVKARNTDQQAALAELRRSRGLTPDGRFELGFTSLNRLIMQSGAATSARQVTFLMAVTGVIVGAVTYLLLGAIGEALIAGIVAGIVPPAAVLLTMRSRRLKKFESQLPEAIDILVRSLKAGHPLPVAIAMVAREMPDPIGSEFGIAADEMTYGLDLETAMANMRARAGQSDLSFLVVAVSIQSKTGGNLAEILTKLSTMVRARARMRNKVLSMSAEGRFSAVALSIIPLFLGVIITLTSPNYFDDVKSDPLFMPAVYFGLGLWLTGILIMRRMVNFKV